MSQPNHLPETYRLIYQMMDRECTLSDERRRFFEDTRLKSFWEKVDIFTNNVPLSFDRSGVGGMLTGSFFIKIDYFLKAGSEPSPAKKLVRNQKNVDLLIKEAINHTSQLIDIFEKIQELSGYYPDEIYSIILDDNEIFTENFLYKLNQGLGFFPDYKELFEGKNGLIGRQSDTWMNWFLAVNDNLNRTMLMYDVPLNLELADWVNLYRIFFAPEMEYREAKDKIKKSIISHLSTTYIVKGEGI